MTDECTEEQVLQYTKFVFKIGEGRTGKNQEYQVELSSSLKFVRAFDGLMELVLANLGETTLTLTGLLHLLFHVKRKADWLF